MDLYEAISVRRSCRRYDMGRLPGAVLGDIRDLIAAPAAIDADAGVTLHLIEDGGAMAEIMPGVVGAYGKVRSPHYLLGTGPSATSAYENAGFALEPVVLQLNAWRIGTCWVGGSAKGDTFRRIVDYPGDHVPLIIVTLGDPAEEGGHRREQGTATRKPLEDVLLNDATDWRRELEAARVAPSAGNLQPWRFLAEGDRLHAYMEYRVPLHYRILGAHLRMMNHLDVGIALSHVRIAAQQAGRPVRIERGGPERDGMTYVATAVRE